MVLLGKVLPAADVAASQLLNCQRDALAPPLRIYDGTLGEDRARKPVERQSVWGMNFGSIHSSSMFYTPPC